MVADVATQQRVFFLFYIHFVLQEDMASMAADLASQQRVFYKNYFTFIFFYRRTWRAWRQT